MSPQWCKLAASLLQGAASAGGSCSTGPAFPARTHSGLGPLKPRHPNRKRVCQVVTKALPINTPPSQLPCFHDALTHLLSIRPKSILPPPTGQGPKWRAACPSKLETAREPRQGGEASLPFKHHLVQLTWEPRQLTSPTGPQAAKVFPIHRTKMKVQGTIRQQGHRDRVA